MPRRRRPRTCAHAPATIDDSKENLGAGAPPGARVGQPKRAQFVPDERQCAKVRIAVRIAAGVADV